MSKIEQKKAYLTLDDLFNEMVGPNENTNWKLVRERDNLTKYSNDVRWVYWSTDGKYESALESIQIGCSLIMSPFTREFTWQTTAVTEITEDTDTQIKFKTKNSNYTLYKILKNR